MFLRRLGPDPHLNGAQTPGLKGCPDVFELETGDFAIIGKDITPKAIGQLPTGASCGPDETNRRDPAQDARGSQAAYSRQPIGRSETCALAMPWLQCWNFPCSLISRLAKRPSFTQKIVQDFDFARF